jgi:probable HAF family extracellular repeat protein
MFRRWVTVVGVLCLTFSVVGSVSAVVLYTVTDLGTLGGQYRCAVDIDNSGQVVGGADTTSNGNEHAYRYSHGAMVDLGTLGGLRSRALGINDSGQIVGWAYISSGEGRAFLYTHGAMTDLGTFPGGAESTASDINASGQVAGYCATTEHRYNAFLYSNGVMTNLGTLPGRTQSFGWDINDGGQVVGTCKTDSYANDLAFLYAGGTMTSLGTLGGLYSSAYGINNSGQVVGGADTTSSGNEHAYRYSHGAMADLGTLPGGLTSRAYDINANGEVVGYSSISGGGNHAFLYRNGTMIDLNAIIDPTPGWKLQDAFAINDSGQIASNGTDASGHYRAFLLTPVPEPSALALLAVGAVGLLGYAWRRRRAVDRRCAARRSVAASVLLAAGVSMAFFGSETSCHAVAFTRVADESTSIPAGLWSGQPFNAFTTSGVLTPPGIDDGKVIFLGKPASGSKNGVFKWADGAIGLIADPSTPPPDGGSSFNYFRYPSVQGGQYAFSAHNGIYRTVSGVLTTVYGPGDFTGSSRPSLDGSQVWFFAETTSGEGVYRWNAGSTTCVAAKGQAMPDAPGFTFTSLNSNVAGGQGNVAFFGVSGSRRGIYKFADGSLQRVADNTMPAPGNGAGTFTGFLNDQIAYDGQTLGFVGIDSVRGYGLYLQRNGRLEAVAMNGQRAPGGGTFTIYGYGDVGVSTDAGHVAFSSTFSGGSAIYADLGGSLERILATGDTLFGQTIQSLQMDAEGLSGDQIAFAAEFAGGNSGIFVATVPEPSTLLLLAAALLGPLACIGRRRRKGIGDAGCRMASNRLIAAPFSEIPSGRSTAMTPRKPVRFDDLDVTYSKCPGSGTDADHRIRVKSSSFDWYHVVFIQDARDFGVALVADGRILAIRYLADGKESYAGKTFQSIQLFDRSTGISLDYADREVGK